MKAIKEFIGVRQLVYIAESFQSEARQFYFDRICKVRDIILMMPKTGQGDGQAHAHYFTDSADWWILEKPVDDGDSGQCYGLAKIEDGRPELEELSIPDILANGAILDLDFIPCNFAVFDEQKARQSLAKIGA